MEKLDLEFCLWILWKGRSPKRRKRFLAVQETYQDKVTVLRTQKDIDGFWKDFQEKYQKKKE